MKVLLTGHLGYIGTVMTPMLTSAGHSVTGCDSNLYERCTFDHGGRIVAVPSIRKDIRDLERRDLTGFDAVVHLAALSTIHCVISTGTRPTRSITVAAFALQNWQKARGSADL